MNKWQCKQTKDPSDEVTSLYWTGKETQDPYWIQCYGYKFVNNSQINEEKKYIYNDHDIMRYSAKFNNKKISK